MHDFLKNQYQFSDYQIAQLQYLLKTFSSEFSKLLIMGFIFRNQMGVYFFAVTIMLLLRTATGGLHCKKYISCFLVSFTYMFLSLNVLPLISINKVFQLILLFFCMIGNYFIGPVTSVVSRLCVSSCSAFSFRWLHAVLPVPMPAMLFLSSCLRHSCFQLS
ncbi:accessory gene regulator protein B [Lachnospiraceae bacterium]|nr:accessory gene regulator protein B [Lachnospiraceae bacterium]